MFMPVQPFFGHLRDESAIAYYGCASVVTDVDSQRTFDLHG
jgi:hypothetical protein